MWSGYCWLRLAVDIINLMPDKYFKCTNGRFYPQREVRFAIRRRFFMLTQWGYADGARLDTVEIWPPYAHWHYFKLRKGCSQASEVINVFQQIFVCMAKSRLIANRQTKVNDNTFDQIRLFCITFVLHNPNPTFRGSIIYVYGWTLTPELQYIGQV